MKQTQLTMAQKVEVLKSMSWKIYGDGRSLVRLFNEETRLAKVRGQQGPMDVVRAAHVFSRDRASYLSFMLEVRRMIRRIEHEARVAARFGVQQPVSIRRMRRTCDEAQEAVARLSQLFSNM